MAWRLERMLAKRMSEETFRGRTFHFLLLWLVRRDYFALNSMRQKVFLGRDENDCNTLSLMCCMELLTYLARCWEPLLIRDRCEFNCKSVMATCSLFSMHFSYGIIINDQADGRRRFTYWDICVCVCVGGGYIQYSYQITYSCQSSKLLKHKRKVIPSHNAVGCWQAP